MVNIKKNQRTHLSSSAKKALPFPYLSVCARSFSSRGVLMGVRRQLWRWFGTPRMTL